MPLPLTIQGKIDNMTDLILRNSELDIKTKLKYSMKLQKNTMSTDCHTNLPIAYLRELLLCVNRKFTDMGLFKIYNLKKTLI